MRWQVHHGDILDVQAEASWCVPQTSTSRCPAASAEPFCCVGGPAMQDSLSQYLADRGIRHVEQGEVVTMAGCGSPYRAVLHAVAVDGFYESSIDVVSKLLSSCLRIAAAMSVQAVAMTALATGYGRKPIEFFGEALDAVLEYEFPPIDRVIIGLRSKSDVDELLSMNPKLEAV